MASDDERMAVAERLRGITEEEYGLMFLDELLDGCIGTGCRDDDCEVSDWLIVRRLADLIDPTCEVEQMAQYVPSHEFSRWRCGSCGAVSFAPRPFSRPRFCPGCGARVVGRLS